MERIYRESGSGDGLDGMKEEGLRDGGGGRRRGGLEVGLIGRFP